MCNFPWRDHALGEPGTWPLQLQTAVAMCLASPAPTQVWWGDARTLLYNDAAADLDDLHPDALGRPAAEIWGVRWNTIREAVDRSANERLPIVSGNLTIRPLIGSDRAVAGFVVTQAPVATAELASRLRDPLTMILAAHEQLLAGSDPALATRDPIDQLGRAARRFAAVLGGAFRDREVEAELPHRLQDLPVADLERPRILFADDNDDLRNHIADMFSEEWAIEHAGDGERALALAMRSPPDLVIADVIMPELGGIDLTRALRGNSRTSHVPVILVTARSRTEARAASRDAGADDYIVKPFAVQELRARVNTLLELSRVRTDAMRKATSAKDDFLAMIGHELRNPLAAVSMTLQALMLRSPSAEVSMMERAVRHLARLVDDLLESSRLSRAIVSLQKRPTELAQVIDRALELVSPEHDDSRRFTVSVPRSGWRVEADPERLARAIGNVLRNAVQHSQSGTRITVDVERAGDYARLRVADEGIGIAPERLNTIFDSFRHARAMSRPSGGLGLGLAIARGLVELHGGEISVTSGGIGQGTTCTISLPTTIAASNDLPRVARTTPRRLLLVEDNDDAGRALKAALEQLGYEVALAHNGPIALNLARTFQPDVALLDLGLPVMDGWELARRLRTAARELPIVAVTAKDQEADKQRSAEIGFADHLVKPINLSQLAQIVEMLPERGEKPGDPAQ